jgi:hypothetical protein
MMDMHIPLPPCPPTPIIRPVHIPTPQALQAIRKYIFGNQDVTNHHTMDMDHLTPLTPPLPPAFTPVHLIAPQAVTITNSSTQHEFLDQELKKPRCVKEPKKRSANAYFKAKSEWQAKPSHLRPETPSTHTKPGYFPRLWRKIFGKKDKPRKKPFARKQKLLKEKGCGVTHPVGALRPPVLGSLPTNVQPQACCMFKPLQPRSPPECGQLVKRERALGSEQDLDSARMRLEKISGIKIESPERTVDLVTAGGCKGPKRGMEACDGKGFREEAIQDKPAVLKEWQP